MKYYEVPLYWSSNYFFLANPNDISEGWASESDLIHNLAQEGFREIAKSDLPDQLVDNYGYSEIKVFADENRNNFTATACKY